MNAPTLIVGLGGTGSKIALKVANKVSEDQRQKLGFAVFDTDVNELREIREKNPFVHTIQTSTKLSVGEYLDIDKHARDTWFPVNPILNSKTLTEGAGQVRAVSRMAFETAVRAGKMEELHRAIEDLYKLEGGEYEQALRVIIVSSLAGGTGSGLILPVALYIKNFLATRFRQSANITRGFFLLPEVFYGVIPGQAERNNLKSNAYATLRELDAFLMKGDSTLPDRYQNSVKIEFPMTSSEGFEEYRVRPYDFCFLFDAQNADGRKLNSFGQYLDHAANCIYAQSIGPMNKRSNSSEDNTIRKLCAERGRNRYAGAGTSMLIYPTEDVKKYLALSWAKECVSDQWMIFDRMYKQRVQENAESRKNGVRVAELVESRVYIDSVEQLAKNKNAFARAIVDSCAVFDSDGLEKTADKWDAYIEALQKKIELDNESGDSKLDAQESSATSSISDIEAGKEAADNFVAAYEALKSYKNMITRQVEEKAATTAYTIFRSSASNVLGEKLDYQLETYLRDAEDKLIHPCAIRYFLYKVQNSMSDMLLYIQDEVKSEEDFFNNFERANFDDPNTDEVEGIADIAKTKKVSLLDKVARRLSADQEDLKSAYNQYLTHCKAYRVNAVYEAVLKEGIRYVKNLSDSFQIFFRSFDSRIGTVEKEVRELEKKYVHTKGTAARYVCASAKCLNTMLAKMPYMGGSIEIDGELSEAIYSKVRDYAMLTVKSENVNYFRDIFDRDIINYFRGSLMKTYGPDIDMEIITAIEKEAEYEEGLVNWAEVEAYIVHVFNEAKVLASPFIEKPLGEEKDPINSCTFNEDLFVRDDSPRSVLIDGQLMNFGGAPDGDIEKNMILFYKSFYGLRANDLSKFAPPQKGDTYNRQSGEYFKAYYELVSKIDPVTHKSKVITPHIDRWWHNVSKMPDLDDENQEKQYDDVYAAFIWAILSGYVSLASAEGQNKKKYVITRNLMGNEQSSKTLVVSNGTDCDCFYEVLDAISIYPEFVTRITQKMDALLTKEINDNVKLENSNLMKNIRNLSIDEFPLRDASGRRSIFDIPLLLKRSMTSEIYEEEKILRVLKVIIEELKEYIGKFCTAQEFSSVAGGVIVEQFGLFLENTKEERENWRNIYSDFLFMQICDTVIEALENIGLDDAASESRALVEKTKREADRD